ncbi:MAG: hypothetical protein AMXMBFR7_45710 [Planctomycetota bacterium]
MQVNPEAFWIEYREALRARCRTVRTLDDPLRKQTAAWTEAVIKVARGVMESAFSLEVRSEYLNLDLVGVEPKGAGEYDFDIRIAFEHENKPGTYMDELFKLSHVVADLRVLATYYTGSREKALMALQSQLASMEDRIRRQPDSEWLFIWGPVDSLKHKIPYAAFAFDTHGTLIELDTSSPFMPSAEFKLIRA